MRLREIRKQIQDYGFNDKIKIEVFFKTGANVGIANADQLFSILDTLSKQKWNYLNYAPVAKIIKHYGSNAKQVAVSKEEYDILQNYVDNVNILIPVFLGIVDTLYDKQDENYLNIKLSPNIKSVKDLKRLVDELKKVEDFANLDGRGLNFAGFDRGSNWIEIFTSSSVVVAFLIACVELAKRILETKEQFHKTEYAKALFRAATEKQSCSDKELQQFLERYAATLIEDEAAKIAHSIKEFNGHEENEIAQKAIQTTKSFINIIGDGNQVQLSIDRPPTDLLNNNAEMIDYGALEKIAAEQNNKKPELPNAPI